MMEINLDPTDFWKPLIAVILCFLIAQVIKMILDIRAGRSTSFFELGHMPSTHAAAIIGLTTVILIETGLSLLFLMSAVIAAIVITDAVGVRRETSRHSAFLNELTKKQTFKIVGHEPMQVFVGALIGIVVPFLLYAFT